jgi:phosphate uptake regulator
LAAVFLMAFSLLVINYRPHLPGSQSSAQNMSAQPAALESEDQQLMTRVSQRAPEVRRAYEDSLREVNTYITDAQQAVEQDPQDAIAREQLLDAYQQKEMLYEMATARTLP